MLGLSSVVPVALPLRTHSTVQTLAIHPVNNLRVTGEVDDLGIGEAGVLVGGWEGLGLDLKHCRHHMAK